MKRFLREPWIMIALVWFVLAIALSFFETQASGLIGNDTGWWFVRNLGLLLEVGGGEGFGWVFGFHIESNFCGLVHWREIERSLIPLFHLEKDLGLEFQVGIPHWIPVSFFLVIGIIRLKIRERKSAD